MSAKSSWSSSRTKVIASLGIAGATGALAYLYFQSSYFVNSGETYTDEQLINASKELTKHFFKPLNSLAGEAKFQISRLRARFPQLSKDEIVEKDQYRESILKTPKFLMLMEKTEKEVLESLGMNSKDYYANYEKRSEKVTQLQEFSQVLDWMTKTAISGEKPLRIKPEEVPESLNGDLLLLAIIYTTKKWLKRVTQIAEDYFVDEKFIEMIYDERTMSYKPFPNIKFLERTEKIISLNFVEEFLKEQNINEEELKYSLVECYFGCKKICEESENFKSAFKEIISYYDKMQKLYEKDGVSLDDFKDVIKQAEENLVSPDYVRKTIDDRDHAKNAPKAIEITKESENVVEEKEGEKIDAEEKEGEINNVEEEGQNDAEVNQDQNQDENKEENEDTEAEARVEVEDEIIPEEE